MADPNDLTSNLVPVLAPTGEVANLDPVSAHVAVTKGARSFVYMTAPTGEGAWVSPDHVQDALGKGAKIGQPSAQGNGKSFSPGFAEGVSGAAGMPSTPDELTAAEQLAKPTAGDWITMAMGAKPLQMAAGMVKDYGQNIYNRGKQAVSEAYDAGQNIGKGQPVAPNLGKAALGAYQTVNAAIPLVGEQANKVGEDVAQGNYSAASGRGLATTALMGIGGERAGAETPRTPGEYLSAKIETAKTAPQRATYSAETAHLPDKAIAGAEDIFRAAAPTGKNANFRPNLYIAAGDLAEIARKVDISESKGGIISPDMRVKATVDAITDHLNEMAQQERAAPVQRHATEPVPMRLTDDARRGLEFLSNSAGESAEQKIAGSALNRGSISLAQADALAQTANKYLRNYERLTPDQKLSALATNSKIGGLKNLDKVLSNSINGTLDSMGEPNIRSYERRYAALSDVRNSLRDRVNAVELDTPGAIKGIIRPVTSTVMGGKTGIASASQAAVADVNIGKTLQSGLKQLADSGIKAQRSVGRPLPPRVIPTPPPSPRIAGLLPAPAIPLGGDVAPAPSPAFSPTTRAERLGLLLPERTSIDLPGTVANGSPKAPPVAATSRAERLGLLLPEKTGGIALPGQVDSGGLLDAESMTIRDPKTGRFKKFYLTSGKVKNQ